MSEYYGEDVLFEAQLTADSCQEQLMLCESKYRHQVDLHDSSLVGMMITLPKTNCKFISENRPKPKSKGLSPKHHVSGANC